MYRQDADERERNRCHHHQRRDERTEPADHQNVDQHQDGGEGQSKVAEDLDGDVPFAVPFHRGLIIAERQFGVVYLHRLAVGTFPLTPALSLRERGDHCVVINARHAIFKGSKNDQKMYRRHTLYPGGLRETSVKDMFETKPEKVIELAVKGMLPKTKLGKAMAKKLKVYADGDHRHSAQKPESVTIETK